MIVYASERGVRYAILTVYNWISFRANLNLLEGWACQVGFKDSVLHYLAKFSSAIDLLATPSEQLLKVIRRVNIITMS